MSKDKEERRIQKVKIALMRNPKFALWSGVMMVGSTEIRDNVPTAMTNGRDEIYGREFVKLMKDDKELAFVVLHENLHKAFRHMYIWRNLWKQDAMLANMACDYVINLMLTKMDPQGEHLRMPKDPNGKPMGCLDTRFDGMNAKQVFDILKQEQKGGGGKGKGKGGGKPSDGHGQGGGIDQHDWEGAGELSEKEQRTLEKEIDQALRQGQIAANKAAGKEAGGAMRELAELLEPKIDWREVLREFVKAVCRSKDNSSWRRVNRRYLSMDVYMPSLIGERIGDIVIGADMSGSIGGDEVAKFLTEIRAIADNVMPEKLHLLYWDTAVAGHEEYTDSNRDGLVQSTRPKGGGGTDVSCVFDYIDEKKLDPQVCIILTDGYTPYPANPPSYPVLWVMTTDQQAPWGRQAKLED